MIRAIFPTPVYVAHAVLDPVQAQELAAHCVESSTPRGWHCDVESSFSDTNHTLSRRAWQYFESHIHAYTQECFKHSGSKGVRAWSNRYQGNSFQEWHDHTQHGSSVSGVYILEQHPNDTSGLTFRDPMRVAKLHTGMITDTATPPLQANDLILFPSYLEHCVQSMDLVYDRVTVSFNCV